MPCGSPEVGISKALLRLRSYRLRPARRGVRKCRPMPSISSHACCICSCCPRFTRGLWF